MVILYKLVVFDLDGTLVNSLTDLANSVNKGLKAAGLPQHSVDAYKYFVGNGREKLIERAIGKENVDIKIKELVRKVYDDDYAIHSNDNTCAYNGCREMLFELDELGVATAVLSNKPDEFVDEILQNIYPDHKFTTAWGNKPQYKCKPNPEALLELVKQSGFLLEECLYIGDSDVDVFTANNAGVDMLGVDWGFRGRQELLDAGAPVVVSTPKEIIEYIKAKENEF